MEYLGRPSLLTGKVEMIEIVRIVNSVFESNTYLAISRNCDLCFLIDCGDPAPIIENINNRGLHLKGIFITHSHFDHIYGLDSIIVTVGIQNRAWYPSLMNIRKLPSISLLWERKACTPIN